MRSLYFALFLCCYSTSTFGSLDAPESPNSVDHKLERKPLLSPEEPAILENSKRTKREPTPPVLQQFQDFLTHSKQTCGDEFGIPANELLKSLLDEPNPTSKEKCLIECILKRSELMDANNRLSTERIAHIANIVSDNNPLVSSIAMAAADRCNKSINAAQPCEAAAQINRCIANEMKTRKIRIFY